MFQSQRITSFCLIVAVYLFGLEVANSIRTTSIHLMQTNVSSSDHEFETVAAARAEKPIWKRAFGIVSKFKEADLKEIEKLFGDKGTQLAVLLPGEKLGMAYKKGRKDYLLLTPMRLIHIDGEKAKVLKRLAGDKGKVTYTTYPWRHITDFKTTTLGALETFDLNKETELEMKLSSDEWLKFEFAKKVDILKVNKYFSDNMFSSEALLYADLPVLRLNPKKYTAETTGRLHQISYDALPGVVGKTLARTERVLAAFSYKKLLSAANTDYVVVTNKRVIDVDKQGASKVELASYPFSSRLRNAISAVSVTTAGGYDLDSEMFVDVYGVGRFEGDFTRSTDTLALYKQLNEWVLS